MGKFSDDDKRDAEVLKLRAEEKSLSRPYTRQPAFWIALVTILVSLVGNWYQFSAAEVRDKLAQIEEKEHKHNADQYAEQELQLKASIASKEQVLDEQAAQLADLQSKLQATQAEISKAGATRESLAKAVEDLKQSVRQAEQSTTEATQSLSKPLTATRDVALARDLELKGYQALTEKRFDDALSAFNSSENAANGYHYSYEIARLLRQRKDDLGTASGQREVLAKVASKYSGYATPEQRQKLLELAR